MCRATTKEDRPNFQTETFEKGRDTKSFLYPSDQGVKVETGEGLKGSQSPPAWRPGPGGGQSRGTRKGSPIQGPASKAPNNEQRWVWVAGEGWGCRGGEAGWEEKKQRAKPPGASPPPRRRFTWESCRGLGQPKSAELELKLMAPRRLRTCWGTGLSRGSTGSW